MGHAIENSSVPLLPCAPHYIDEDAARMAPLRVVDIFEPSLPSYINQRKSGSRAEGKLVICPGQHQAAGRNSTRTVTEMCAGFMGTKAKLANMIMRLGS